MKRKAEGRSVGAVLALGMLWVGVAQAEIYRWVDDKGQVHFGQRPAAGSERVEVKPQVIEQDAATRERQQAAERFFDARREERAEASQQAREQREQRRQECQALRRRLEYIDQPGAFYTTDEAGERSYISDEKIKAERQQLRQQIENRCQE